MTPTKEMIEAVEYMAETGTYLYGYCINCPGDKRNNDDECDECDVNGWADKGMVGEFSQTLQTSAKNWLKQNKPTKEIKKAYDHNNNF